MEKVVRIFNSFEEADAAELDDYRRYTPEERVEILLEMRRWMAPNDESAERLERVLRVTEFSRD